MKRLLPCLLLALAFPLAAQFTLNSDSREGKPILINSDAMNVDIDKGIATFFGNVIVNDPDVIITCKKMILFQEPKTKRKAKAESNKKDPLSGDNTKLERIECIDDVVITRKNSGDKSQWGTCGKAVYFHKQGTITMTIEPVLYQDDSKITGTRLTFFRNSKQIEGSDIRITARNFNEEKKDERNPDQGSKKSDADTVDEFYKDSNKASENKSGTTSGRVRRKLTQKEADALLGLDQPAEKKK